LDNMAQRTKKDILDRGERVLMQVNEL
jgi:hypothetical protein